ncbi:lasso peptide biosynthesis PqqD family chaperone [Dehalobacter sp. UNSWDHB]|uniref:lasso peptide biosynthesis PqqD family chaperone n=1 Tax=Dehalobacter sp. UNSWDHB TaxID=1339256 RepID=UPI00054F7724|nr:lasso peptide biosynthesis PqqD family chaperone [Dehalobacter sp. UNSWDHB]
MRNKEILLNSIVERRKDLPVTEIDGEKVMMNMDKGKYYGMDAVGSRIWNLMEEKQSVDEIVQTLLDEYEVDLLTCQQEVLEFFNMLYNEKLLNLADAR